MRCCDKPNNDAKDPVCGMTVDPAKAAGTVEHRGANFYFCGQGCATKFRSDPEKYLKPSAPSLVSLGGGARTVIDPVCGMSVVIGPAAEHLVLAGDDYWFCGAGCRALFAP